MYKRQVGQHQIWVAQSYDVKNNQQMFFSGGHGAMGFALPAGIGGYYASRKRSIVTVSYTHLDVYKRQLLQYSFYLHIYWEKLY